ncbi:MAG: peptidylprolyl isomerase [Moraxellaceae bacterium]|nr:peptidylprolyl isomerase [Pseudobdellovibrionaceae bacterium]
MKWIFVSLLSILLSLNVSAQKPTDVVAIIGAQKITLEQFNKKYAEVLSQVSVNPPSRKVFLEDIVRYELGVQQAKKMNLEKDPLVADRINQEMYKGLLEKELGKKVQNIKVSDEEMKTWYAKNPQIRLSVLIIEVKPGATAEQRAEAKKRALEILSEVKKSKRPFEELVRLYSDDTTTKNIGGDVGWQSRITLNPSYYDAAIELKLNSMTQDLVETAFGFHIIKLTGKHSFEEAPKREIRMAVFDDKRKVLFDEYFSTLKKTSKIQTNPKLVE